MEIIEYTDSSHLEPLREIISEYVATVPADLTYQGFEREISHLREYYFSPGGVFFFAMEEGKIAGGVGYHKMEEGICEMKRFYVRPAWRNHGIGHQLIHSLLLHAKKAGYHTMKLSAMDWSHAAIRMYKTFGFTGIPHYYETPYNEHSMQLELADYKEKEINKKQQHN